MVTVLEEIIIIPRTQAAQQGVITESIVSHFLRLRRKRRLMYTGKENRQAICRWRHARRLAWLLKEELPEELTELAEKAKFSQHTLTAEELEQFQTYLESAENRLKKTNILRRTVCKVIFAI